MPHPEAGGPEGGATVDGGAGDRASASQENPDESADMDGEGRHVPCPRHPRQATQKEIDEHWEDGHYPPRSWCAICTAARSVASPHGAAAGGEKVLPVISIDTVIQVQARSKRSSGRQSWKRSRGRPAKRSRHNPAKG